MADARSLVAPGPVFRTLLALLLCAVFLLPATAQDGAGGGDVFAPFVSRVRISMRDPEVRLTWRDSSDVEGIYLIYRHTVGIDAGTFLDAELIAEVQPGVQSFIDAPAEPGSYYYAIIATSATGEPYEIFIPYRNTTAAAVTIENIATLEERSARVQGISATVVRGTIRVDYQSSQVGRELIVYRSIRPLTTAGDLTSAGVVSTVLSTVESVTDYPVPGVPYYYAVADGALVADGSVTFVPGENVTAEPVEVPLTAFAEAQEPEEPEEPAQVAEAGTGEEPADAASTQASAAPAGETATAQAPADAAAGEAAAPEATASAAFVPVVSRRRPLPLPFLQLNTNLITGNQLGEATITVPSARPLSNETIEAVSRMTAALAPVGPHLPSPQVLEEDTLPSPRGAEFTLRTILDGPFTALAWEEALLLLNNFLTLPLPDDIRARAMFYRAQCYFFTGETKRAFLEFLLARDAHFEEVDDWLNVILSDNVGA